MRWLLTRVASAVCSLAPGVLAHDGPPYPILVDEELADCTVSVWADPDVGIGTFYFYVTDGETERPLDADITLAARPLDGHVRESSHATEPASDGAPFQRVVEVPFDARGAWLVRLDVPGPAGSEHVEIAVEVTPPGGGALSILLFLSPFVAVALLWIKIVLKQTEHARLEASCDSVRSS